MSAKPKPPAGWGDLNVALNSLAREGVLLSYSTGLAKGTFAVEVTIDKGADQAEVVRRVRESLPAAFSEATVRTRAA